MCVQRWWEGNKGQRSVLLLSRICLEQVLKDKENCGRLGVLGENWSRSAGGGAPPHVGGEEIEARISTCNPALPNLCCGADV